MTLRLEENLPITKLNTKVIGQTTLVYKVLLLYQLTYQQPSSINLQ